MTQFTVDFRGMKTARRNINALVDRMAAEKQVEAVQEGADLLRGEASARVPVSAGPPTRGGLHLKDAIITEVTDDRKNKVKIAVGPAESQFHGIFIELGTIDQPAEPFLRPAADEKGAQAARIVREKLAVEVVKTATRLHRRGR